MALSFYAPLKIPRLFNKTTISTIRPLRVLLSHAGRMPNKTTLTRFTEAMHYVYGPFEDLTPEDAKAWIPPDRPGAGGHRGRYLWTDAFGVVNFITLFKETRNQAYLELSKSLVQRVHDVLGRTRDGKKRLLGATDKEPMRGGLRIGKLDASGSDGDGQYHHYLTLWMFALNRLSIASGDGKYNDLAIQLAEAIHPHFVRHRCSGRPTMVWKMSTDLTEVLVGSEGHLDSATGYVVCRLLQTTNEKLHPGVKPVLAKEIDEYERVMRRDGRQGLTASSDLLDLGMGLWMCHFFKNEPWAARLGEESLEMARSILSDEYGITSRGAPRRLSFREFGTCLGLACYGVDDDLAGMSADLIGFWEEYMEVNALADPDLRPISLVMYAAAIKCGAFRDGYLS